MSDEFLIDDNCKIVGATPSAVLVESEFFDTADCKEWIPQSMIHENSEVWKKGQEGKLIVCAWFARKRGWC